MGAIIVSFIPARADVRLKQAISAPSFPISTPVIPAKAGIRRAAGGVGMPASAQYQHALGRVDIGLKWTIAAPSSPISNPVIPAKAGIQTA